MYVFHTLLLNSVRYLQLQYYDKQSRFYHLLTCISQILKSMQYATELLLRVYLCLTSNAFSFLLPSHASCMCLLSLTAICYNRSYLMIANAKICHTCSQHVHFANRMQLPAAGCLSHTECHTSVRAPPLTADLEPPWTVFVHDCIARCSSFQERPTLPNLSLLASTSCAGLCFGGGSLGASKPTIFSHSRYTQGTPRLPSWFHMPRGSHVLSYGTRGASPGCNGCAKK